MGISPLGYLKKWTVITLNQVTSHERADFKRCPKKWYYKWRRGLVPKAISVGALDLGTWVHDALSVWYGKGLKRRGHLVEHYAWIVAKALSVLDDLDISNEIAHQVDELALLGEAITSAYEGYYDRDSRIDVIATEVPLEFTIADEESGIEVRHRLKPDLIYLDPDDHMYVWLMEHKTAAQIRTAHLVIDDQARPYGVMAERAMKNAGIIDQRQKLKGIMYNFIRKALPDLREQDAQGRYLNKNGTVSKKQPATQFLRHPVTLTNPAKLKTLERVKGESILVASMKQAIIDGRIEPAYLPKTPHWSCPRFCDYFTICTAEENGMDTRSLKTMEQSMFIREDPYSYYTETNDPIGFEMG